MIEHNPALCHAEQATLVMVDVQSRLLATMGADDRVRMLKQGSVLLEAAKQLKIPVLVTEQYPAGLGASEPALVAHLPADTPTFSKTCFSACGAGGFAASIARNRPQVVLFGLEAHVCILQTALALQALGKQVFIAEDAICSRSPLHRENAIARLRQAGITLTNSESVMFEWLQDSSHDQFKSLSALIK